MDIGDPAHCRAEEVRELEAELAAERIVKEEITGWWKEQKARLEKAEAELAKVRCNCPGDYDTDLGGKGHNDWCPASPKYVPLVTWKARAEKAEKELARWEKGGNPRARRAEARIAELERMEEFWHNLAWLQVPHDLIEQKLKNPGDLLLPDMREE